MSNVFALHGASKSPLPKGDANDCDVTKLQTKLEIYQRAIREWAQHLTSYEFTVLTQIMDRTIGWGLREASFSTARLREGDSTYGGIGGAISRRMLFNVLASLETKGVIRRRADPGNKEKVFYAVNPGWMPDMVNLPKRLQNQCTTRTTQCTPCTTPVHDVHPIYEYPSTSISFTDTLPGDVGQSGQNPADNIRVKIETATARHRETVTDRAARLKGVTDKSTGVEAAWRAALIEAFPGAASHAPWNHRVRANVKRAAATWLNANQFSFEDFAAWAVTHWTAIISKQFAWMKDRRPPAVPTIAFFLYFIQQFAECWSEGKLVEWMNNDERTEVERWMARGMTRDEAAAKIGKDRAVGSMRNEMRKREAEVSSKLKRAAETVERARKIAEAGAAVHPRSHARHPKFVPSIPTLEVGQHDFGGVPLLDPAENPFD